MDKTLIAENEKLKTDIGIYKGIIDAYKEENERLKNDLNEAYEHYNFKRIHNEVINVENLKYNQALQEIREMIDCANCEYESNNCNPQLCDKIETKINEVIGAKVDVNRENKFYEVIGNIYENKDLLLV